MAGFMVQNVPVASAGMVASATMISRWRGAFRVTAIAKATFSFVPGGEMQLAAPVAVAGADVHAAKNPMRSVRASSDVCPHLERADVLFVGRAHAPRGEATASMRVRLAIADDTRALLDKRLEIVGERAIRPGAHPSPPTPFQNMVIAYEKALGGLGRPDNPLGVGAGVDAKLRPNIFYADPSLLERVAGYGPLAASWPVRKKLLRGKGRPSADGLMELPDDFDWSYFQAAPVDQQIDALPQRAWILLEGLSPRSEQVHMRLPAVRTLAKLFGVGAEPVLPLRADTLFIDGDAEHCTVTFRGSFQVPNLDILGNAWIGIAIEAPGHQASWPSRPEARGVAPSAKVHSSSATIAIEEVRAAPPVAAGPGGHAFAGTMIIDDTGPAGPAGPAAPPPFSAPTSGGGGGRRPPEAMILGDAAPPAPSGRRAPRTMLLDVPLSALAPPGGPPGVPPAPPPPLSTSPAMPRARFTGTLDGSEGVPSPSAKLPFSRPRASAGSRADAAAPLPGAPWAGGNPGSRPVPAARSALSGTMTIDEDDAPTMFQHAPPRAPLPVPPAPPPPAGPPAAPPPAAPMDAPKEPVPRRRSDAYHNAVQTPKIEPPAASTPKPSLPSKQDIGGALYRRKKT